MKMSRKVYLDRMDDEKKVYKMRRCEKCGKAFPLYVFENQVEWVCIWCGKDKNQRGVELKK